MSASGGLIGGMFGLRTAQDTNRTNERNVTNTNAANLAADMIARGAAAPRSIGTGRGRVALPPSVVGSSSAVLPYYFGGAESQLANASTDLFNASFGLESTQTMVPTTSIARYTGASGEANIAADRAELARAEQRLAALGGSRGSPSERGQMRERINLLRNRLTGATPAQSRSGVNPQIGAALAAQIAEGEATVAGYEPQVQAGDDLVSDLFSGDVTNAMLRESEPVQAGRIKLANMERDADIEALQDKLNEIRTIQAKKGFTGDSLAKNRLDFDARRRIGTDSARRLGGAELENATEVQRIQGQGRDLQFRSLDMPFNRAQQRLNLANLPTQTAQQRFSAALAPMQFFRTGGANFQVQGPPERSSVPGMGQLLGTAFGSANDMAARALLDRYGRPTPTMPTTVVGPNGQAYLNTGSSYTPAYSGAGAGGLPDFSAYDGAFEALSGG